MMNLLTDFAANFAVLAPSGRADYVFNIANEAGALVVAVVVTADDIDDYRKFYGGQERFSNDDIALDIYEQRYEGAVNAAGYSYDDAIGFTLKGGR